jgi:hypothetical protein
MRNHEGAEGAQKKDDYPRTRKTRQKGIAIDCVYRIDMMVEHGQLLA